MIKNNVVCKRTPNCLSYGINTFGANMINKANKYKSEIIFIIYLLMKIFNNVYYIIHVVANSVPSKLYFEA